MVRTQEAMEGGSERVMLPGGGGGSSSSGSSSRVGDSKEVVKPAAMGGLSHCQ